ncbi:MAG: DUF1080 domain-containing protein [Sphingobacteriales bacterium]|nr:MAG: DUF1080 domain-containing protein [Sphingobacteriales bacterium]
MFIRLSLATIILICAIALNGCKHDTPVPAPVPKEIVWTTLLDSSLSHWDKWIGVPHYSVDLPGYPKGDGMNGTPIGLNNDPLSVYKIEAVDGKPYLHISGQIYGGLTTKKEYENYHLKLEFKWGEKKYEPRLNAKRDNGILYHCYGPHGKFWNVWMNSQEFQIQEADMGDYYALGPLMDIKAARRLQDNEDAWIYEPTDSLRIFGDDGVAGRCRRGKDYEKPHGEWNTLELICLGDSSIHIVNGMVVMRLKNSRRKNDMGMLTTLTRGVIQIQSEGAEAWYRNIQIRQITEVSEAYR